MGHLLPGGQRSQPSHRRDIARPERRHHRGQRLARLRGELLAAEPRLGWLQVLPEGRGLTLREGPGRTTLCIGADGLEADLAPALMAALAQGL